MERIDSHQHFWKYDPARHSWMNEKMDLLKKDYGPKDLAVLLSQCGLHGSVAVQASQSEEENEFLLGLAESNPIIKGIVGWVDLQSDAVSERLSYYSTKNKIKGFRHVIHDEPDVDFMLRPAFLNGLKALKNFNYTYDILIFPVHLSNTLQLVRQFPDQPFVIDHIAKPMIHKHEISEWKKGLIPLASLQNVYCKISGMVTEAHWKNWTKEDFTPYLETIVELFGSKRILYGSDWPVCTLSASYAETYGIVKSYFEKFSVDEQDDFFGMNAKRFYHL
ncbi:MAG TPA: amidohydrolase family protein [Chitinophagaceae bacterium]|nr:amidohydrolase family protein [Chitinophagaceae bacterium]